MWIKLKKGVRVFNNHGIAALYYNGVYSWAKLCIHIKCG